VTRRDYVTIARALKNVQPHPGEYIGPEGRAWLAAVYSIAHALSVDNPRFDGVRFVEAAGVGREAE